MGRNGRTLQIDVMRLVSAHPRDLLSSHGGHTDMSAANAAAKIPRLAARPIEDIESGRSAC